MSRKSYILIALAVLILGGLLIYLSASQKKNYNWYKHYKWQSEDPYGLSLLNELLNKHFEPELITLTQDIKEASKEQTEPSNYLFIGQHYQPTLEETKNVLDHVSKGNEAFIFAEEFGATFLDSIFEPFEMFSECFYADKIEYSETKELVTLELNQTSLKRPIHCNFRFYDENHPQNWPYISSTILECQLRHTISKMGSLEHQPNFIKVNWGKGLIYIHTTPLVFTNYHLSNVRKFKYAQEVFNLMTRKKLYVEQVQNLGSSNTPPPQQGPRENPIRFLFSVPSLKAAWITGLLAILLYLFLAIKRKQKEVPIHSPVENQSLKFTNTISYLFLKNEEHTKIATYKLNHYFLFLKERYGISLGATAEERKQKVVLMSGVNLKIIESIERAQIRRNDGKSFNVDQLEVLVQEINLFYETCK